MAEEGLSIEDLDGIGAIVRCGRSDDKRPQTDARPRSASHADQVGFTLHRLELDKGLNTTTVIIACDGVGYGWTFAGYIHSGLGIERARTQVHLEGVGHG